MAAGAGAGQCGRLAEGEPPGSRVLVSEVPWGGFKGSGYGRDLFIYALDDYSRTKHVMHNVAR
jgi:acyl-CoA reductase-like NAD-dependent aldehyde dehydrogenase